MPGDVDCRLSERDMNWGIELTRIVATFVAAGLAAFFATRLERTRAASQRSIQRSTRLFELAVQSLDGAGQVLRSWLHAIDVAHMDTKDRGKDAFYSQTFASLFDVERDAGKAGTFLPAELRTRWTDAAETLRHASLAIARAALEDGESDSRWDEADQARDAARAAVKRFAQDAQGWHARVWSDVESALGTSADEP